MLTGPATCRDRRSGAGPPAWCGNRECKRRLAM